MKKVVVTERIPIKLWLDDIEEGALDQAKALANLPFTFKHISLMPDCHLGYSMPIGGVMATKNVIIPAAVGFDIGCGMAFSRSSIQEISKEQIKKVMGKIRERVPMGFNHHKDKKIWDGLLSAPTHIKVIADELVASQYQLGTGGSGNHFIEIQMGSNGYVGAMIHSGSRNFGLKIAKYFHEVAKELCEKYHSNIPTNELAFLPMDSIEGNHYESAMNFALDFAKESRNRMMEAIKESFVEVIPEVTFAETIDVHHNYARMEHHFNENVMVHRKGATSAKVGEIGLIPGSQGTKSYIVNGLGNTESFMSCSHGAGRKMGRKEAQRSLNLADEIKRLDDQGIVHSIRHAKDLDEASGAYKDIATVMENQSDLVEIVVELSPLAVIKA